MGKKIVVRQVQDVKISKKTSSLLDKKQLNSMIKVLRPKVYITDSSSFKTLVQHLTGDDNIGAGGVVSPQLFSTSPHELPIPSPASLPLPVPPPPPPSSSSPEMIERVVPVIDVEDDDHDHGSSSPESSMQYSYFDATISSIDQSFQHHLEYDPLPLEYGTINSSDNDIFINGQDQEYLYGDLHPLLADVDDQISHPNALLNLYSSQYQQEFDQEVSIYDYELSGLI